MNEFRVVIPARYASTRLPGKPLVDIGGRPMVVRVAQQARASGAAAVVVATDHEEVAAAVRAAGFEALMTREDHRSGSDRAMEVAERLEWPGDTVVVNVQGDEPLIPPQVISQVAELLLLQPDVGVATLCEPLSDAAQVFDPNIVKVVVGGDGFALYFSRAPVPFARDAFSGAGAGAPGVALPRHGNWYRHVGIYAFRLAALSQFVALPAGELEQLESLEQLRLLENGIGIHMARTVAPVPGGVDTEADLQRLRAALHRDR